MNTATQKAAKGAKKASLCLMGSSAADRNLALQKIAELLATRKEEIFDANRKDLLYAAEHSVPQPLINRLKFDNKKLNDVIRGIRDLAQLPDPIGRTTYYNEMDKNLELYRVTCPIGVIGVIFESRPDALVQISTLCLKSGNAVVLKGGSEASETNRILTEIIQQATDRCPIPHGWIQLLFTREDVKALLDMDDEVDLLIPRGSNAFVKMIMDNTRIPVLGHADGVCHIYIDEFAQKDMVLDIVTDAKTEYVSACNTVETLLIHEKRATELLPLIAEQLGSKGVKINGCSKTCRILGCPLVTDWHTEYLDYQISIQIVSSLDEAILHINQYGSGHTDSIITDQEQSARTFMMLVDSGNVFWNCSTRFSDGFRYGFGAEVGISTSKIHARGPVGLEGLVTYKYQLFGNGQIVADYSNGKSEFVHKKSDQSSPFE